jgi:hypothetical protein
LACADTLDDHKVTITVERDRTVSAPTNPGRRPVVQRLPITQHRQYVVGQQLVPAEHPVVPGEVVGVQHRTLRQRVSEPPRQAGLAAGAVTVDRYDRRASRTRQADNSPGEVSQVDGLPVAGYQILTR